MRLKQLREESKLTQEELAEAVGVKDDRTIRFWESGENAPKFDNMVALAKVFRIRLRDLFELSDPNL